ncbi:hypothetical protein [Thalassoroseus pseudoceratinae]|uniref:hypothetical protein n=1 Tax=Thalassoroseus pseudoceratinae TaxID=2713176 RepID=UPI001421A2C5|nr:hypothetical protein [Thalassoroseus pseudoceratinae]
MKYLPIIFALGTALFWGIYGPTLGKARSPIGAYSGFKPYLGIGLAYLVIAIVGGSIAMSIKGDDFSFKGDQWPALQWGFLAGCLGAFGALCLTSALVISKGDSRLVMPIVFGGAVTINALVSAWIYHGKTEPSPWMWVGTVGVIISIVIVAMNIPHPKKPASAPTSPSSEAASNEAH